MIAQALAENPNECCGLLAGIGDETEAGRVGRVVQRYPLINSLARPTAFLSDPQSMFEADRDKRQRGLEILAVYHSHPQSAPIPSQTDLAQNYSEDVMNLIVSLKGQEPELRGWWLTAAGYREAAASSLLQ